MEGSLDKKQRGIPKLRELLRRQRRESEGQIDVSPDIDFVYNDADKFAAEIAELYTYTEEPEFILNKEIFERDIYWHDSEPRWSELAEKEKLGYLLQLFDRVEAADASTRLAAARILLYLVQGNFGEFVTDQEQKKMCKQNVFLLYKMGIFPVVVQLLNMEIENSVALTTALNKPSISIADSIHLRVYLNILYTFVETMRCFSETDTEEIKYLRRNFVADLGQPIVGDETLAVTLFEMVLKFCAGTTPHFPIKKILLLLWKTILVSLGGAEKIVELKRTARIAAGLSPSYEEQCPTLTIVQKKRLPVPQTPPSDGDSSDSGDEGIERDEEEGTIRLRPKIREKDLDIFLDNARSKFVGFQLRSDRSTIAGLPESIHEAVDVLKKHLYISLAEKQIQEEEESSKRPLTRRSSSIPSDPTEKLYKAMLPNLPQYMIALLKILLAAAPTAKAKTDSINILADVLPEDMPSTVLHSMRLGIDVNRHKEIIVKSISGILFLLLKHLKLNHIYQFEFMSQHLVFANCIPLILKFLNQNLSAFITAKNTIPLLDFPTCVLGDPLELTAENLENVETEGYCWRNLFSCINLVRILQKLTKWKHSRTMMLVVFKSAPILKRALKVKHEMMQLYVLKLLKAQTKYLGRNWRKSNMKTMSAIYQKVRHRLNDDWAYGNDLDARPWDFQAEECALRTCVDRFNNKRYGLETDAEKEEDKFTSVDNNLMSVLGRGMELGAEFKDNYEKWLDREVFATSIDWDQLCSCPSDCTIKIKPGTSSV